MERDFKGIWIPKEIWLDERLSALDKIILSEINSLDGDEGCYASNQYLAEFCQCSESKVSKSISFLIKLGYVVVKSYDGRKRFLQARLVNFTSQTSKKCYSESQKMQDNNIYNNIDNKVSKKVSSFEDVFKEKNVSDSLKEAFLELIKSRSLNKKKMTNHALELAIDKVRKMETSEERQIAIIEQSIENGWQGLFPLKDIATNKSRAYEVKANEDISWRRLFDFWYKVLGYKLIENEENVMALKQLLTIDGETGVETLIASLKMRSEHSFLTKELKSVADFSSLLQNRDIVWAFYNKNRKDWANWTENSQNGKEKWRI